jgi:hypothetical protein
MAALTFTFTRRQCTLVAKAIDYEITALRAQSSYEPGSDSARAWYSDIRTLVAARRLIAGDPPTAIYDEATMPDADRHLIR